ncbi:methyl-accepting chemotaxis protein [Duganella vulcania]|uniref:HAMP domain-containing protein n=1 Tax=Duganella vulcania TaxID=2692166 RepID=A0A845GZ90_9BURK|nr:methyl-accepting chemotaxis protein [Duganella vulcania]MYM98446.1 HAMP domain-containing protein [Duganella vulcania]
MKMPKLNTGVRVMASFAALLFLMACMSAVALWRLQTANDTTSNLVDEKLAKQQLTSELLGIVELNGLRATSIARSDSLEVGDIFQAQLTAGEKLAAAMEARLAAMPAQGAEAELLRVVAARKSAYLALRAELFKLKDSGRTQEVGDLLDNKMAAVFGAYTGALDKLLAYQTQQAKALAAQSAGQFQGSRVLLAVLGLATLALGVVLALALTRSIVQPLRRALALAGQVAAGELRVAIQHGRSDEMGQLFDALSHMTGRLAETVGRVRDGAVAIDAASREIANGNMDLSRRTEHQAGALEETASAMVELTEAVRQNSGNARQANRLAESASDVAGKGGAVVSEVVRTMASINEYAHKIVDITSVIDGIAFQTNILALNAAVEAARAGEQGRGFAVVASEVRNLAQRSASAAKEIKQLINESAERIASGSELAQTAGATMAEIVLSVEKVTGIMSAISAASAEQEHGIEQVNAAISDMDGVTQQNAALVEEAAAAADAMQDQARELAQLVGSFKIDGGWSQRRIHQFPAIATRKTLSTEAPRLRRAA